MDELTSKRAQEQDKIKICCTLTDLSFNISQFNQLILQAKCSAINFKSFGESFFFFAFFDELKKVTKV